MDDVCCEAALRGSFYRPAAESPAKVCLDERVHRYLSVKAQLRGVSLDDLVNDLLKKSIELSWRLA
jgi:predicted HicB family RNase H-like nuclease